MDQTENESSQVSLYTENKFNASCKIGHIFNDINEFLMIINEIVGKAANLRAFLGFVVIYNYL